MIFIHSDLIGEDNTLFFILVAATLFALLVGIAFHEACHAFMANALGDQTPARQGRTTLNPMAHLDPAGTVMMLIVGFGWGKPVQFNPYGLKTRPRTAMLLVSAAGPLSNFVAASLLALPIKFGSVPYINPFGNVFGISGGEEYLGLFLSAAVYLNVILCVFNLVPIHPLDGFKVVLGLLPDDLAEQWASLAQYGPPILMTLILLPWITSYFGEPISPLRDIIGPIAIRILRFVTGIG